MTALRNRVNQHVGHLFEKASKRRRDQLRAEALSSSSAFHALLEAIRKVIPRAYDVVGDPKGLLSWASAGHTAATSHPLTSAKKPSTAEEMHDFVSTIVGQFKHLVEKRGLNKELYSSDGHNRHELTAQRLFFAVAYSYCKVNDVDITPEAESGNGPVDFKMSRGFHARALVEIKLSTNHRLVDGYRKQLETYKSAEETTAATYLVVDVGSMGKKDQRLRQLRKDASRDGARASVLEFIDGILRPSASKR